MKVFWTLLLWVLGMLTVVWGTHVAGAAHHDAHGEAGTHGLPPAVEPGGEAAVYDPSDSTNDRVLHLQELGVFSCATLCHDKLIPNSIRREGPVAGHPHVALDHGSLLWCLDCHEEKNRDVLHLIDGSEVGFNESYRLCGQCHGPIYRDWRFGAHGQRTGHWNAEPNAWPCVRCHDPHSPAYKPLDARPAPKTRFDRLEK